MQQLYHKALAIKSAIPHPRIMGIIRECGGKMHMAERQWEEAATDFFEAFKNYDEAGNQRRIQCLKYVSYDLLISLSFLIWYPLVTWLLTWYKSKYKRCNGWLKQSILFRFDLGHGFRCIWALFDYSCPVTFCDRSKHVRVNDLCFFFLLAMQRYLVLANMLMESEVNPFDGQEAKP